MKHAYTDEWWETSLKDIKLSEIFDFDFVLKSKPIFENKSKTKKKEEDKKQEEEKNKDYEKRFLNAQEEKTRTDLNKYIVL